MIGVDEVGRGCLAGPVVAAAVILDLRRTPRRFYDSKQLSEGRREELSALVLRDYRWSLGVASVEEIDRLNIYHASLLAMRRAVLGLEERGGHVLVDGVTKIPELEGFCQTPLVRGDDRAEPISAASIVAKVWRDRFMKDMATRHPDYGFEAHKGYGTRLHKDRLARFGPCELHRRSFNWGIPSDVIQGANFREESP